jgi:hypothetical protein
VNSLFVVLVSSERAHGGHGESATQRMSDGAGRARGMPKEADEQALRSATWDSARSADARASSAASSADVGRA